MLLETKQKTEIVSIPFVCAAGTDVGLRRNCNEDTFIFDAGYGFFLVADGMGGHDRGELAAKIAAETIQTGIRKIENSAETRLRDSIILANNAVFARAQIDMTNMGCVLTALLIEDNRAAIGHVGDTRVYKIHRGKISKLTNDHSFVGKLGEEGDLSEKRLMQHPRRNEVTRCVGFEEKSFEDEDFVEISHTDFESDAAFLLCSDGLSDLLTMAQTLEIVEENAESPQIIIKNLIEKANELGGKDNITVVFIAGKDFANEAFQRKNTPTPSKTQKLFSLFFTRWAFFVYGTLLGGAAVFLYRLFSAGINVPIP